MMYRCIPHILLVLFFVLPKGIEAQHLISGKIISKTTQEPLIGATVEEIGKNNGTISDIDGNYTLELSGPMVQLMVKYVGFDDMTMDVNGQKTIIIEMVESSILIDQVVVVGYGRQKKSDLTGAVSSLKGKELERITSPNVEQALQGKIAGVYVTPASGQPGANAVIRIRGTGTLNNSNPLYVVDGMITEDASSVNPQDVESIEVLKDASSAAIYGSRGANGVIIITTKNGKKRKNAQLSFSSYLGTQEIIKKISLLNGSEFARSYNQLRGLNYYPNPDSIGIGTDWQEEILQQAPIGQLQFGANGATDLVAYNFSANYFDQKGILKNTSFNRVSLRLNVEMKLKPWFTLGTNTSYAISKEQLGPNAINSAYRIPSVLTVYDETGEFTDPTFFGLALANPIADQFYNSNKYRNSTQLLGNIFGEILLHKNLRFRSNYGYFIDDKKERFIQPKFEVSASQINKIDRLINERLGNINWIWEQTLQYQADWKNHSLGILAGYTAEERTFEKTGAGREGFPGSFDEVYYLSVGNDTTQTNFGEASDESLVSFLFRTNYSYKNKYLMTASMRVDKSSRFKPDNRTGYFPSASVGWNLGNESFIEKLAIFDRLKVRMSYGILGNQAVTNRYPTSAIINSGLNAVFGSGENVNQGATQLSIANPNLKWEVSHQTDLGLEAGFFDDRWSIELDWYRRLSTDVIAAVPIPDLVGSQDNPFVNTASVLNSGLELSSQFQQSGTFSYQIGFNITTVQNEVKALAKGKNEIFDAVINGEPASRTVVGLPIGAYFGYQVDGIFQNVEEISSSPNFGIEKPGDIKFKDVDGNGKLDAKDRTYLGSPIPTMTYGFNIGAGYGGFDMNIDFFGVYGNKVFNEKETGRFAVYNWEKRVANAWTVANPSDTEPRVTNGGHNYRPSDRFIQDGSFLRLRTISLGYTLPMTLLSKLKIESFRFFVSGTNLWTKQSFTGYSPEFPDSRSPFKVGFDNGTYPIAKSIQFGFETKF